MNNNDIQINTYLAESGGAASNFPSSLLGTMVPVKPA